MNPKTKLIQSVPLFDGFSKRELEEVATLADEVDVPEGRQLISEGKSGKEFVVLLDGVAEVTQHGELVNRLGPGDSFGEVALITHEPRTATVETRTPARLLVFGNQAFRSLLARNPRFETRVRASASQYI